MAEQIAILDLALISMKKVSIYMWIVGQNSTIIIECSVERPHIVLNHILYDNLKTS